MQTRLIPIGNAYGIEIPGSIIKELNLDKGTIDISVKDKGLVITPVSRVPPLSEWDRLFKEAISNGFDPQKDREAFRDLDITDKDGEQEL